MVASFGQTWFLGWKPPSGYQVAAIVVLLAALAFLVVSTLTDSRPAMRALAQRLVLFGCSGNTSRSPMAQALCNDEILRRLGLSVERHGNLRLRAVSAEKSVELVSIPI